MYCRSTLCVSSTLPEIKLVDLLTGGLIGDWWTQYSAWRQERSDMQSRRKSMSSPASHINTRTLVCRNRTLTVYRSAMTNGDRTPALLVILLIVYWPRDTKIHYLDRVFRRQSYLLSLISLSLHSACQLSLPRSRKQPQYLIHSQKIASIDNRVLSAHCGLAQRFVIKFWSSWSELTMCAREYLRLWTNVHVATAIATEFAGRWLLMIQTRL